MKILFEHANMFSYVVDKTTESHIYCNCLIARVCFENDDKSRLDEISGVMLEVFNMLKPNSLVLFPFSHLSSRPLKKEKAVVLLLELKNKLSKVPVIMLPYGISKGYKIDIKSHRLNNIFRSI